MPPVFGGGPGGGFVPIIMLVAGDWFAAGRGGGEGFFIVFAPFDWRGGGGFGLFAAASDAFDSGGSEEGDGFTPFIIFDNSSFAVDFFVFFPFFFFFFVGSFMLTARFNLNHANAMISAKPPNTLETIEMTRICVSLFTADLPCSTYFA